MIATPVCSTLAGCGLGNSVEAGTLIISHDRAHAVTVTISKTREDAGDVPPRPRTAPAPTTTRRWERDYSFEVSAGGTTRDPGLVSEPGDFYVDVSLATGQTASTWLGLYPAGQEGPHVAEAHSWVSIYEDGRVTGSTRDDD